MFVFYGKISHLKTFTSSCRSFLCFFDSISQYHIFIFFYSLILLESTLKEFNFGFNKLTKLNPDISLFLRLTTLDLRYHSQCIHRPLHCRCIYTMSNKVDIIFTFHCRNNGLSDLPRDMESLQDMREIVLSCNR